MATVYMATIYILFQRYGSRAHDLCYDRRDFGHCGAANSGIGCNALFEIL